MDDLISRRDAINVVGEITTTMSVCTSKDECYGMKRMQKQAITELENMPPAEPEHPDINVGNMDAISRRQAIRWVKQECNPYGKPTLDFESGKRVMEHLEMMPSVQPEIIRCKDCKYCEHWYADKGRCFLWHEGGIDVFEEGFCNYAERREDG